MRYVVAGFTIGLTFLVSGCGDQLTHVKGKVTIDGAPLEQGLVRFESVTGNAPSSKGGIVKNGEFTAEVPLGEMKVIIIGSKVVGKRPRYEGVPDSPMDDKLEEVVPAKYHKDSQLKVEIKANNEPLMFKLESK